MGDDILEKIINIFHMGELYSPIKTRAIAEMLGISIYNARCYLCELQALEIVDSIIDERGMSTLWYLVR